MWVDWLVAGAVLEMTLGVARSLRLDTTGHCCIQVNTVVEEGLESEELAVGNSVKVPGMIALVELDRSVQNGN